MKNNFIQAYQKDWRRKILEKGRIESQDRVYCTLSKLFREILHRDFKGNVLVNLIRREISVLIPKSVSDEDLKKIVLAPINPSKYDIALLQGETA